MVQIWYPADTQGQEPVPWMTDIEIVAPAISEWIDMPAFFLDHLKYAVTASYPDIPISSSQARFPVLIFSHGFGGFRAQNTYQMQELASHGYIILAPEHTYASVITVFPDGRVAEHNPNTLPDGVPETEYDRAAQQLVVQWTADLQFVLDTLALMDEMEPVLRDRLDLTRIGFLGHSTGGGATVQVCALDLRCKAGLGMDAWLVPVADTVIENGPQQPFLFLYSELWPKPKNMALYERLYGTMGSPVARFTITGTAHYDFTDLPALSPLAPYIGLKGPLNGSRVQEIIDTYTLAFFDSVLKGEPSILLSGNSEIYSEVIFVEGK
jgi:dienelactone hydrolase